MDTWERAAFEMDARLKAVEECQADLKGTMEDWPSEAELEKQLLAMVENAWGLQRAVLEEKLPGLIRAGIIEREKEREAERQKTLTDLGLEIGPDGQPRPKGGSVKAFFRKNGTTIGLISLAIVIIRPDLLLVVLRFLLSLWGL